jgi:hypothetical protein
MKKRSFILLVFVLILSACASKGLSASLEGKPAQGFQDATNSNTTASELPQSPPDSCPVTRAPEPRFTPPSPFPRYPESGFFWHGTSSLWTAVPVSRTWENLPHDEQGYTQKVFWWNENYFWRSEPQPELTVTGERLDAPTPALHASKATNGFHPTLQSFMLVGVEIPTPGCWQITAEYKGSQLSFVVWVAP